MILSPSIKLLYCLIINIIILIIVIFLIFTFADKNAPYWQIGPNNNLIVISVKINTYSKYFILLFITFIIQMSRVFVEEMAMPILGFSIYNPDKKNIPEFTKNELQFYANSMFIVSGLRGVFLTMISISQIDIAIWNLLIAEFTSLFTIRILLNEKTFIKNQSDDIEMNPLLSDCST
jgi:hypothetical protein